MLESFHTCPVPEIARLGRTLRSWSEQFLAYFTTGRANNGGTEAVNGIIELHRRIAAASANPTNYRLRMILAAGKLTHPNLRLAGKPPHCTASMRTTSVCLAMARERRGLTRRGDT